MRQAVKMTSIGHDISGDSRGLDCSCLGLEEVILLVGSHTQLFIPLQILRLLAEDAPLETKRSYKGEPSHHSLRSDSPSPSRVENGQHRRMCASESARHNRLSGISKLPTKK
jgi:hypothetical protein